MHHVPAKRSIDELAARFNIRLRYRPLRPPEVSELTHLTVATLQDQRHDGTGIPYFKQGKFIYYAERDVLEWLAAGERRHTSEVPSA